METTKVLRIAAFLGSMFNLPRVALNPVLGVFRPLERTILEALLGKLNDAVAAIARSQLAEINFVQLVRASTTEIDFYALSLGGVRQGRRLHFPQHGGTFRLAVMVIVLPNGSRCRLEVHVVHGNLFAMEFDADVARWRNSTQTSVVSVDVVEDCSSD